MVRVRVSDYMLKAAPFLLALCFLYNSTKAQESKANKVPLTRILFVFDASQSMSGTWESDEKIDIARDIMFDLVDSLKYEANLQMALRIYGHQSFVPPQDCNDTKLEVPFAWNTVDIIKQKLKSINPKGTTPIAHSLAMAVNDFPKCDTCRNIIILITDGIEACDGDPCAVSLELQKNGIVLKPFVIGIGIDPGFKETFECVGYYYNAHQEEKFKETLGFVISQALNSTTAQVNLIDENGQPDETNVNMTFIDQYSGRVVYNYIHTLNHLGNPDTLELDHLITYQLVVHTIPAIVKDSINIFSGKHTVIPVPAPQGYLYLKTSKGSSLNGLPVIVRQHNTSEILHIQYIDQIEKYLTGKYDLEIPVIPKIQLSAVNILQSQTTQIDIPLPGQVNFVAMMNGFGSVYEITENEQKWACNLSSSLKEQQLNIQPGNYRVVFRPENAEQSLYTITRDFVVESNRKIMVHLY